MILSWLLRNTYLESKGTLFLSWKIIFQKEKTSSLPSTMPFISLMKQAKVLDRKPKNVECSNSPHANSF